MHHGELRINHLLGKLGGWDFYRNFMIIIPIRYENIDHELNLDRENQTFYFLNEGEYSKCHNCLMKIRVNLKCGFE